MNKLFFLLILFSFVSCSEEKKEAEEHAPTESTQEPEKIISPDDKVISMVDTLKEVVLFNEALTTSTKLNPNHLTIWIAATPEETLINYYWIKVGEDNGTNIVTQFNFYVDPVREKILYYDVINDTLITLEEWRKK